MFPLNSILLPKITTSLPDGQYYVSIDETGNITDAEEDPIRDLAAERDKEGDEKAFQKNYNEKIASIKKKLSKKGRVLSGEVEKETIDSASFTSAQSMVWLETLSGLSGLAADHSILFALLPLPQVCFQQQGEGQL